MVSKRKFVCVRIITKTATLMHLDTGNIRLRGIPQSINGYDRFVAELLLTCGNCFREILPILTEFYGVDITRPRSTRAVHYHGYTFKLRVPCVTLNSSKHSHHSPCQNALRPLRFRLERNGGPDFDLSPCRKQSTSQVHEIKIDTPVWASKRWKPLAERNIERKELEEPNELPLRTRLLFISTNRFIFPAEKGCPFNSNAVRLDWRWNSVKLGQSSISVPPKTLEKCDLIKP